MTSDVLFLRVSGIETAFDSSLPGFEGGDLRCLGRPILDPIESKSSSSVLVFERSLSTLGNATPGGGDSFDAFFCLGFFDLALLSADAFSDEFRSDSALLFDLDDSGASNGMIKPGGGSLVGSCA